jgi:hypothetical protein
MTQKKVAFAILACLFIANVKAFANAIADPCDGPSALLNLIDRPTKADSACAVPYKKAVLELGYQAMNLRSGGSAQNYPEAELRIGLPGYRELVALLPNYNYQTVAPHSGYDASVIGLKQELGYNAQWLGAIEALLGLPTGGNAFGSNKYQPVVSGIVQYTINPNLSVTLMLGAGSQTISPLAGGQSYFTINPDLVFTWQATEKLQAYGEIYGQSRTAPGKGAGFAADAGILYLFTHYLEVDAELGQRISGNLGGFNNFVGIGMGLLFG